MAMFSWFTPFRLSALRRWSLPIVIFILTAPLWLHWFEPSLFLYLNALFASVDARVWTSLSLLGNGWAILGLTAPLLVFAPRLMLAWLCTAPFAILFARTGKFLLDSPRPAAVVDATQIRVIGDTLHNVAMPSGHTVTAFAVASALYFSIPKKHRMRYAWLWLLALGAGLSRIAVGAHWPGDVAVGASLGILSGLLGSMLVLRIGATHYQPRAWSLRAVAVLVALAIYHLLFEALDFVENRPFQYVLASIAISALACFVVRCCKQSQIKKA